MMVETFQTLDLHIQRAKQAYAEVVSFSDDLNAEALDDFNKVKVIDSFILRFIKIQDLMGNKLFREVLIVLGEYEASMSMLDVLDRLEKLELIPSALRWMDYRNLRNILTHEYPDNRVELIEGVQLALQVFQEILHIQECMYVYMDKKGLIK